MFSRKTREETKKGELQAKKWRNHAKKKKRKKNPKHRIISPWMQTSKSSKEQDAKEQGLPDTAERHPGKVSGYFP